MLSSRDRIILKGIRFHGYHGISESERQVGQKYEVDVELICSLSAAGSTDDLKHTVDYGKVRGPNCRNWDGKILQFNRSLGGKCGVKYIELFRR